MSDHLSLSQLTDWVHGCLADDESAKVEQHLEACDKCAKLLDDVDSDTKFESRVRGILHSDSEDAVPEPTVGECPGSMIGPYKLLQLIGEGGMGAVWMAQQERPVQRTVALKIIKAGMDTKEVIARFETERQALAMMDHPNIASVLGAGATEAGRPYFVMELVRGVAITDYCDRTKLVTSKRLELFCEVCDAIQHAHHKGIIHRDIKPSNILVKLNDGKPIVKVIDFGVAKATGTKLTEKTLHRPRTDDWHAGLHEPRTG